MSQVTDNSTGGVSTKVNDTSPRTGRSPEGTPGPGQESAGQTARFSSGATTTTTGTNQSQHAGINSARSDASPQKEEGGDNMRAIKKTTTYHHRYYISPNHWVCSIWSSHHGRHGATDWLNSLHHPQPARQEQERRGPQQHHTVDRQE